MKNSFLKIWTTSLSILGLSALLLSVTANAQGYGENPNVTNVRISDPYVCGQNISGRVAVNGLSYTEVDVEVSVFDSLNNLATTFTPNLDNQGNYTIFAPHNTLASGSYTVRSRAFEIVNSSNSDTWEFGINIKKPNECSIITTIRTGAMNTIKNNGFTFMVGSTSFFTALILLFGKFRSFKIER